MRSYQGPDFQSIVNGQNINCYSKCNILFTGIFAEKKIQMQKLLTFFSAKLLAFTPYLMTKGLTIRLLTTLLVLNNWALYF